MISKEEILKVASLSKLNLSEREIEKFQKELSGILDFFKELEEVDTNEVEPTAQITGLFNHARADEVSDFSEDNLLSCSARPIKENHVLVPSVL